MATAKPRADGHSYSSPIPAMDLLEWILVHPGASNMEIKNSFLASSGEVRKALGKLMAHNKVYPMAHGKGLAWCPVDGKRGRPNVDLMRSTWTPEYYKTNVPEEELDAMPELDTKPGKARIRDPHGHEAQVKADTTRRVGKVVYGSNPDEE